MQQYQSVQHRRSRRNFGDSHCSMLNGIDHGARRAANDQAARRRCESLNSRRLTQEITRRACKALRVDFGELTAQASDQFCATLGAREAGSCAWKYRETLWALADIGFLVYDQHNERSRCKSPVAKIVDFDVSESLERTRLAARLL